MESKVKLPLPTKWVDNPYQESWASTDYMYSAEGPGEFPNHACKLTYLLSKPFIKQFRTAIDIGCRVGEFTRYLNLDFERVYAFDPTLCAKFRFNVDLAKVEHYHCALGDSIGEIRMYDGAHHQRSGIAPRTVPVFTLDMFDFENVDYIKIDVEGFEKKVLLGGARTIERCNPVIVIEQNHVVLEGEEQYSAKEYLEGIGYRSVAVDRRGWDFVMVRG
jgi:FkbM family methyltransferase